MTDISANLTLDQKIEAAYQEHRARLEREAEARRQAEQEQQRQLGLALAEALANELGAEMVEALGIKIEVTNHPKNPSAQATFTNSHLKWTIAETTTRQGTRHWEVKARREHLTDYMGITEHSYADPDALATHLLILLGAQRDALADCELERKEEARKQAEKAEARRLEQARLEAEQQAQREAQAAEEARCHKKIMAYKTEARSSLWQWPAGVVIALYKVTWCTGILKNEDGDGYVDHDRGWAATDQLSPSGYITIYETQGRRDRTVRLSMEHHKPVWERVTVGCIADVPSELMRRVTISVPGVEYLRSRWDGEARWIENPETSEVITIGETPLHWVQELAEAATPEPDPDVYYAEQERQHNADLDAQEAEREEQEWFEENDETHLPADDDWSESDQFGSDITPDDDTRPEDLEPGDEF